METTKKQMREWASEVAGTLSNVSKMPCRSYNLPASRCQVGQRLAKIKGSVCSKCYAADETEHIRMRIAMGGHPTNYCRPNVRDSMEYRFQSLAHPEWVDALTWMIQDTGDDVFRWHDSGDIQGTWHLENICWVCLATPKVKHWLPTREAKVLRDYLGTHGVLPDNLVVRLSATMIGGEPPAWWKWTSTVNASQGRACRAYSQGGQCLECRDCWDRRVRNIDYREH